MASLFPDFEEVNKQNRSDEIDQKIVELLTRKAMSVTGLPLEEDEYYVLKAIRFHRGHKNAISIRELTSKLNLGVREIKQIVRTLRMDFRLPIGSSKSATDGGYFIILTPEDMAAYVRGPLDQIRAELEVVHAVAGQAAALEILGQLQLELKQ
jgi:hypothetical protein